MKYVLVTGGAGFIGSYISKLFYDKGFTPVAFDNLSLGNETLIGAEGFQIIKKVENDY